MFRFYRCFTIAGCRPHPKSLSIGEGLYNVVI